MIKNKFPFPQIRTPSVGSLSYENISSLELYHPHSNPPDWPEQHKLWPLTLAQTGSGTRNKLWRRRSKECAIKTQTNNKMDFLIHLPKGDSLKWMKIELKSSVSELKKGFCISLSLLSVSNRLSFNQYENIKLNLEW